MGEHFNITQLFFESAKQYPDHISIIEKNKRITFADLAKEVNETSAFFLEKGIKKGDRVLVFVPMSIDLYRIVLAIFNIGATAVFLDEWVSKKRMEECCKIAACTAFIGVFKARVVARFSSELKKIPIKLGVSYTPCSSGKMKEQTTKNDIALITFTTGSTGTPKAAKRTHGFLQEQFNALIEKIDPQPLDIDMPVLPIVLLINLGAGCTSVIAKFKASKPDSMNARKIMLQINTHHVTRIVASPFFVKKLANYALAVKQAPVSVKNIFTGGAPVFPDEAILYKQAFPATQVEIVYGSTEAEPISFISAENLMKEKNVTLNKGLNVGIPYKKLKLKIIRIKDEAISCESEDELEQLEVPAGNIGEIIVSGPHVLREYFNNEEALKRNKIFIQEECWHRTGDSGYVDDTGILYLTGRCNTLIRENDKIISPFIFENYFQSLDGIEIGTIIKRAGKLIAMIETNRTANKKMIAEQINHCGQPFDEIKFLNKIPRDPRHHSRIDYNKL